MSTAKVHIMKGKGQRPPEAITAVASQMKWKSVVVVGWDENDHMRVLCSDAHMTDAMGLLAAGQHYMAHRWLHDL